MAATSNTTMLEDLFVPQVIADAVDQKLIDAIRFAPLAKIDNTLVGKPGDELTMPSYNYVGSAEDVAEGQDIPIKKLSQDSAKVKISKIGLGVQFTDEALLSGNNNDIAEEAATQIVASINDKLENKVIAALASQAQIVATVAKSDDGASGIASALVKFGEDIDGDKVLIVPPSYYERLLHSKGWIPNTEMGANIIIKGVVGSIYGCQVILSNRLEARQEAYILKPGALAIVMKRNTLIEFDRDKVDQTNYIIGSKIFGVYLYDPNKAIKINLLNSASASTDADITSFKIGNAVGEITGTDIEIEVAAGVDLKNVVPNITTSARASVNPGSGLVVDLTAPTKFVVTAEDGTTKKTYTVTATKG